MEIEVQLGVVLLDDDPGGLFDCLGANATHFRGFFGDGSKNLPARQADKPEKEERQQ